LDYNIFIAETMTPSLTEENYLKAIYHLSKLGGDKVSVKSISNALNINPASVIDMLKRLKDKKLIHYDKTAGARLTDKGFKTAINIVRKHRLWEVFLLEKLGYSWDEVHDIAEQLEHIKSADLADRLDKYLGHPEYDPHGDPIPKANGQEPAVRRITLADAEPGHSYSVVGVKDTSPDFLQYVQRLEIGIGIKVKVLEKIGFDGSVVLQVNKGEKTTVSQKFSENIMVA
jgi:DtxR family transcriptional regulator, Mn-dependent transcriptional regulator